MPGRRDWLGLLFALVVAAGLIRSLSVTLAVGNDPWIYRRLRVDAVSYMRGMEAVAQRGPAAALEDPMHSIAYQLYLGLLYAALGRPGSIFLIVKLLSWLFGALCVGGVYFLGESWGRRVGWLAAALLAWSQKWLVYTNVLDYEIIAAALLAAALCALSLLPPSRKRPWTGRLIAAASLSAVFWLHFRFLPCWAAGLAAACLKERKEAGKTAGLFIAALVLPLALALPFHAGLSAASGKAAPGFARLTRLANNPAALGYPLIGSEPKDIEGEPSERLVEPSGAAFAARRPGRFLWLTGQRFLYIWDVKRDYWTAYGPLFYRPWRHPLPLALLQFCLMAIYFAGLTMKLHHDRLRKRSLESLFAVLLVPCALLAPLLTFGSSRYLIPVLPCVALLQAYGLVESFKILRALCPPIIKNF